MTLEQLKYIIEIASIGSMNKAATNLNITQPNLSAAVKTLEGELGYEIFTRTNRGVILTQKGRRLIHYAENIQIQLDSIKYIDNDIDESQTTFSLTSQYISSSLFTMKRLCEQYSSKSFFFQYNQKPFFEVIEDIVNKKADIGAIAYAESRKDYVKNILIENNIEVFDSFERCAYIAVTKNHPLFYHDQVSLEDLQDYPFIHLDIVEKTFFATDLLEKIGYYKHKQKFITRDLFSLYFMCDQLEGVTILTGLKNISINDIFVTYNMEFRLFPIKGFKKHLLSYIHLKGRKLQDVERNFLSEVQKTHLGL